MLERLETLEEMFARGEQELAEKNYAEARAIFLAGVRRAAEDTDRRALAQAFCGLAKAEQSIGNLLAAGHHYANAVLLYRKDGPPERLAFALRSEAEVALEAERPEEAASLNAEAESVLAQS